MHTPDTTATAHTPGPWEAGKTYMRSGPSCAIYAGMTNCVATAYDVDTQKREVCEANARLIAAAPDLLFCLIGFVEQGNLRGTNPHLMTQARAAIARATRGKP